MTINLGIQIMLYTIYQTTNKIDGKTYIGKHVTKDLNDSYIGSGKHLRRAITKHGIENFIKETLFVFDNETDMNAKEAEIVTAEFVLQETNYNLCPGGQGGWGYVNKNILVGDRRLAVNRQNLKKAMTPEARAKSVKSSDYSKKGFSVAPKETLTWLASEATRKYKEGRNTDPSKYNTVWITNGLQSKKIKPGDDCPDGWHKGRTIPTKC